MEAQQMQAQRMKAQQMQADIDRLQAERKTEVLRHEIEQQKLRLELENLKASAFDDGNTRPMHSSKTSTTSKYDEGKTKKQARRNDNKDSSDSEEDDEDDYTERKSTKTCRSKKKRNHTCDLPNLTVPQYERSNNVEYLSMVASNNLMSTNNFTAFLASNMKR